MDKVGELSVFVKVVEEGGFSSAARAMSLTPSAVSKQIGRLEDRLGVRLINRTTRSLSLTPEGRSFFERCRTILTDIEDAESIVTQSHSTPRGSLRITTGVAFGRHQITPLLPECYVICYEKIRDTYLLATNVFVMEEGQWRMTHHQAGPTEAHPTPLEEEGSVN